MRSNVKDLAFPYNKRHPPLPSSQEQLCVLVLLDDSCYISWNQGHFKGKRLYLGPLYPSLPKPR